MGEVCLTELEIEIMRCFVDRRNLKSEDIIHDLAILIEKLKQSGMYA